MPTNIPVNRVLSRGYVVYVDDNFHHGDEEKRYRLGEFRTCEHAGDACRHLIDSE